MKDLHIAVVGHIDHGKSTLLGRLLFDSGQTKPEKVREVKEASKTGTLDYAYFLDNFEEERVGNMTIDVCYLRLQDQGRGYNFIDTPGHKEFLKNMLSGASQAEAAVLLISAAPNEGIQDQTVRHLKLVKLLGINQLVVAINKMDVVNYQQAVFQKIKNEARSLLREIGFPVRVIPFIPVSAKKGINVYKRSKQTAWYQGLSFWEAIRKNFQPAPSPKDLPLRLIVQDVYSFGKEVIVAARVGSGVVKKGQTIIFSPSKKKAKIKEIKLGDKKTLEAQAGTVIGLVFEKEIPVKRGEVGSLLKPAPSGQTFTTQVYFFDEKDLKAGRMFSLRCGLAQAEAKIKKIIAHEEGFAQIIIKTEKPIVIERYQDFPFLSHFVLERNNRNIALGVCLR